MDNELCRANMEICNIDLIPVEMMTHLMEFIWPSVIVDKAK